MTTMRDLLTRDGNPFRIDHVGDSQCIVEWVDGGIFHYAAWAGYGPRFWPDQPPMAAPIRRMWRQARTLSDLGELTARWLEGDIGSWPGYGGSVDVDEPCAPGLTAALIAANRAGIVTTCSQAGRAEGGLIQYAWVDAFATPDALANLNLGGYLIVRHERGGQPVAVTSVDGQPHTSTAWMSRRVIRGEIYPNVGKAALAEVFDAVQVAIIDSVPGRNALWADLSAALLPGRTDDAEAS